MDIKYFSDTHTLLIDFSKDEIIETKDLNEKILLELDRDGELISMTIEHAKKRMDVESFSYKRVPSID